MMDDDHTQKIVEVVLQWVRVQPNVCAAALVGLLARGTARADSDIDLVTLTTSPDFFRRHTGWVKAIEWSGCGSSPANWQDEDCGQLWSRRLWLEPSLRELDMGFALPSWADIQPLDPGTRQVIADGCRLLHDPKGLLARLRDDRKS